MESVDCFKFLLSLILCKHHPIQCLPYIPKSHRTQQQQWEVFIKPNKLLCTNNQLKCHACRTSTRPPQELKRAAGQGAGLQVFPNVLLRIPFKLSDENVVPKVLIQNTDSIIFEIVPFICKNMNLIVYNVQHILQLQAYRPAYGRHMLGCQLSDGTGAQQFKVCLV